MKKKLFCPKKGCQGCHISKRGHRNYAGCTSIWSIYDPCSFGIDGTAGIPFCLCTELCRIDAHSDLVTASSITDYFQVPNFVLIEGRAEGN